MDDRPELSDFLEKEEKDDKEEKTSPLEAVLDALRGLDGKDGKDGAPGKDGKDGEPGPQGPQGERGLRGLDGNDGKDGKDGANGQDGKDGRDGRDGVDGKDGKDGKDGSPDTGEQIIKKINSTDGKKIKKERVEGFEEIDQMVRNNARQVGMIQRGGQTSLRIKAAGGNPQQVETINFSTNLTVTPVGDGREVNITAAGGSGSPGGSTTQVQYNNAGAFGGISGATTDGTTLTLVAPVLGTPTSVTLTNATGLPLSGIVSSTSTALGVGSLEIGNTSDTTLTRVSAGVAAIEGKNIALNGTGETLTTGTIELGNASDTTLSRSAAGVLAVEGVVIPSISSTNTLTNKRITRRTSATAGPGATPTMNTDNFEVFNFTALAAAITSMTTNLSGTPVDGDTLRISFTDNGTARAITWGSSFEASTVSLPTTTVISTRLDVGFVWNTATSKWRCVAVA